MIPENDERKHCTREKKFIQKTNQIHSLTSHEHVIRACDRTEKQMQQQQQKFFFFINKSEEKKTFRN